MNDTPTTFPRRFAPSALLGLILSTIACQDPPQPQVFTASEVQQPVAAAPEPSAPASDSELTEGATVIAGLALPRVARELAEEKTERTRVFLLPAPMDATTRFFAARLLTGRVDSLGTGRVYRDAMPRASRGAAAHLDVAILPSTQGTRVTITELPAPAKNPPSEDELRRRLQARTQDAIE